MKKQYIVLKYVLAESAAEAVNKARKAPVSEVYIHQAWLEKEKGHNMFEDGRKKMGFVDGKK